ncbi:MAG: FMN-binding protein [Planctomycetota bacterium]
MNDAVEPVPSWRLVATLGSGGACAGLLLVLVFQATLPAIEAHKAKMLRLAVAEVLQEPDRTETIYRYEGKLTATLPDGVDGRSLERVFLGFAKDGTPVGFAIVGAEPGFQDFIRLIFGYDARSKRVLGMKVLESKETPGLGDKIEKDVEWVAKFKGLLAPLVGRKGGNAGGESGIDTITGATISSRAIIRIINNRLERIGPELEAYMAGMQ